jgi:hypothetical protein
VTLADGLTIAIGGIGLAWMINVALLTLLIKATARWTSMQNDLATLRRDLTNMISEKDKVHQAILEQIREDRRAANDRLTYLERKFLRGLESGRRARDPRAQVHALGSLGLGLVERPAQLAVTDHLAIRRDDPPVLLPDDQRPRLGRGDEMPAGISLLEGMPALDLIVVDLVL